MENIIEYAIPLGIMLLCVGTLIVILIFLLTAIRKYLMCIKITLDSILVMYAKEQGVPVLVDGEVIEDTDDYFFTDDEDSDKDEEDK